MPKLVGFQNMMIIGPYGMTFDAVDVFCPYFCFLLNLAHHTVEMAQQNGQIFTFNCLTNTCTTALSNSSKLLFFMTHTENP